MKHLLQLWKTWRCQWCKLPEVRARRKQGLDLNVECWMCKVW